MVQGWVHGAFSIDKDQTDQRESKKKNCIVSAGFLKMTILQWCIKSAFNRQIYSNL